MQSGLNPSIVTGNYTQEAIAYFNALKEIGKVTLDSATKSYVDNFIKSGLRSGWFAQMRLFYPIIGGNAAAHSINLIMPTVYTMTWNGTVTHNALGFAGNGSTGYGNTGFLPTSLPGFGSDVTMGFYLSQTSGGNGPIMGQVQTINTRQLQLQPYSGGLQLDAYDSTNGRLLVTYTNNLRGLFTGVRSSTTESRVYHDMELKGTSSTLMSSLRPSSMPIFIGCYNNGGTPTLFNSYRHAAVFAGGGMSDTLTRIFIKDIIDLQIKLNRA